MSQVPIHYIDIRAFVYATEDERRVETALQTLLPPDTELERDHSEGFHGDRILVLSARIERADRVRAILEKLEEASVLSSVGSDLDQRLDDNAAVFFRLDKQAAFQGDISDGDGIRVRIKMEAYPATRENALESAKTVFAREFHGT